MKDETKRPKFYVFTWDVDTQRWTPQVGVRKGPYSQFGLRKALRKLQDMGYETTRDGGVSVLITASREPIWP